MSDYGLEEIVNLHNKGYTEKAKLEAALAQAKQLKRIADALENFNFEQVGEYTVASTHPSEYHALEVPWESTQDPLTPSERAELEYMRHRLEGLDK